MKKIIAMLLALVMVLSLAACGQPAQTTEKITLKVWGPSEDQVPQEGQTVSFLEAACKAFDEAHPEWEIEFVFEVCSEATLATW